MTIIPAASRPVNHDSCPCVCAPACSGESAGMGLSAHITCNLCGHYQSQLALCSSGKAPCLSPSGLYSVKPLPFPYTGHGNLADRGSIPPRHAQIKDCVYYKHRVDYKINIPVSVAFTFPSRRQRCSFLPPRLSLTCHTVANMCGYKPSLTSPMCPDGRCNRHFNRIQRCVPPCWRTGIAQAV